MSHLQHVPRNIEDNRLNDLYGWSRTLNYWSQANLLISSTYLFGSRISGDWHDQSDLDIAILLKYANPKTSLAHWMSISDDWQDELKRLLFPLEIDLQLLAPPITPTIETAVKRSGIQIFFRMPASKADGEPN